MSILLVWQQPMQYMIKQLTLSYRQNYFLKLVNQKKKCLIINNLNIHHTTRYRWLIWNQTLNWWIDYGKIVFYMKFISLTIVRSQHDFHKKKKKKFKKKLPTVEQKSELKTIVYQRTHKICFFFLFSSYLTHWQFGYWRYWKYLTTMLGASFFAHDFFITQYQTKLPVILWTSIWRRLKHRYIWTFTR